MRWFLLLLLAAVCALPVLAGIDGGAPDAPEPQDATILPDATNGPADAVPLPDTATPVR